MLFYLSYEFIVEEKLFGTGVKLRLFKNTEGVCHVKNKITVTSGESERRREENGS